MTCLRCGRISLPGVPCPCRTAPFNFDAIAEQAARRITTSVAELFRHAGFEPYEAVASTVVESHPSQPMTIDSLRKMLAEARERYSGPPPVWAMSFGPAPMPIDLDDRPARRMFYSDYGLAVAKPSTPFFALDMSAEGDYPAITAQVTVRSTPEIVRIGRLHAATHPGNRRRRQKRVLRLLRAEIARQGE